MIFKYIRYHFNVLHRVQQLFLQITEPYVSVGGASRRRRSKCMFCTYGNGTICCMYVYGIQYSLVACRGAYTRLLVLT
jgi:hypothetical protein